MYGYIHIYIYIYKRSSKRRWFLSSAVRYFQLEGIRNILPLNGVCLLVVIFMVT